MSVGLARAPRELDAPRKMASQRQPDVVIAGWLMKRFIASTGPSASAVASRRYVVVEARPYRIRWFKDDASTAASRGEMPLTAMATVDLHRLDTVGAVSTLIVSSAGADLILWPDAESSEEEAELAAFSEAIGGLLERLRSEGRDAFLRKLGTAPSAADNPLSRSLDTAYKSLELSTWYALSPSASDKRRPPTARRGSHNWAASAHLDSAAGALTALARDADLAEPSAAQHPAAVAHTESILSLIHI